MPLLFATPEDRFSRDEGHINLCTCPLGDAFTRNVYIDLQMGDREQFLRKIVLKKFVQLYIFEIFKNSTFLNFSRTVFKSN